MDEHILEKIGYCGIYCGSCIFSQSDLFCAVHTLKSELANNHLEKFAHLREKKRHLFKYYSQFLEDLSASINLEDSDGCRKRGCDDECEVRECAISQALEGCWDCEQEDTCEKLSKQINHYPVLDFHLDIILKKGLLKYHKKRKSNYAWDKK
jgi:hypothetical protein